VNGTAPRAFSGEPDPDFEFSGLSSPFFVQRLQQLLVPFVESRSGIASPRYSVYIRVLQPKARFLMNPSTPPVNRTGHGRPGSFQQQRLRPLKSPSRVRVRTDDDGLPAELHQKGKRLRVLAVRERWRIDDEWWRDPISREYYALVLEDGRPVVLFRDLMSGGWYGQ